MDINNMTKKEFGDLPHRKWGGGIEFDSMIILPATFDIWGYIKYCFKLVMASIFRLEKPEIWDIGHIHDSGYRVMDFVAIKKRKPICLLSGCSDVIHIDGIGGFGKDWLEKYGDVPDKIPPSGWSIDCLAKSGLLRIWSTLGKMTCGEASSSFEIFSIHKNK